MSARIRLLTAADVPAGLRLKEAAGWNQTAADWRLLLRLAPDTSFGLESDGVLAATTTAICYGDRLAWVGMVLTDPQFRRRGFARRLLEHTLELLAARRIGCIKLDATEMGAPLYRALGFQDETTIQRWSGKLTQAAPLPLDPWLTPYAALDLPAFGADRSTLLAALAPLGCAAVPGEGFALARSGSKALYIGPCVCRSAATARVILGRLGGGPAYWDLLGSNSQALEIAKSSGFQLERRLIRMSLASSATIQNDDSQIYATAGFEFG